MTQALCVSVRKPDLSCIPSICRYSPLYHFSKCICIATDWLFITLKLEFTIFSIPLSIRKARGREEENLKNSGFFGLFNNIVQTDQGHQWRGGMGSGPSNASWLACTTSSWILVTHFIFIACSSDVISARSQVSQSYTESRKQGTLTGEAQWYHLQCYWRSENRQLGQDSVGVGGILCPVVIQNSSKTRMQLWRFSTVSYVEESKTRPKT